MGLLVCLVLLHVIRTMVTKKILMLTAPYSSDDRRPADAGRNCYASSHLIFVLLMLGTLPLGCVVKPPRIRCLIQDPSPASHFMRRPYPPGALLVRCRLRTRICRRHPASAGSYLSRRRTSDAISGKVQQLFVSWPGTSRCRFLPRGFQCIVTVMLSAIYQGI